MSPIPTNQELQGAFQKADASVQTYIASGELDEAFEQIRTEHKLHLDEAGKLGQALNAVFLELRPMSEFPNLLREALEQNSGAYDAVLKAVNDKIFSPFRTKLQTPSASEEKALDTKPVEATPTVRNLIDKKELGGAEKVSVNTLSEEQSLREGSPNQKQYRAADPYREPIE